MELRIVNPKSNRIKKKCLDSNTVNLTLNVALLVAVSSLMLTYYSLYSMVVQSDIMAMYNISDNSNWQFIAVSVTSRF